MLTKDFINIYASVLDFNFFRVDILMAENALVVEQKALLAQELEGKQEHHFLHCSMPNLHLGRSAIE